jgi:hypothetical protein
VLELPSLAKNTPATVDLVPSLGMDGAMVIVVIIKQLFYIDRRDQVTRKDGAKLRFIDEPWDEDDAEKSSVKLPSDLCIRKPSTDVILAGEAMGTYKPKVKQLDVLVQVGPVKKVLTVFGFRVWFKGVGGLSLTPPEPFETLPLKWEYAYGGFDDSDEAKGPLEEPRNPVGCGVARNAASLIHKPGPRIEDPRDLIASERTRPAPAGVGALGRHWEPRRKYVGTVDEAWVKERMPLLPTDFDERYNQLATPELITPEYLRGGELVQLVNVSEDGPMKFELPRLAFYVGARLENETREYRTALDTVLLQPQARTVELTWRTAIPVPNPARKLRAIHVHEKEIV